MKLTNAILTAALVLAPAAVFAQTAPMSPAPVTAPAAPTLPPKDATGKTIANRKVDQQNRIANGVQSGQLTAKETATSSIRKPGSTRKKPACAKPTTAS